MVAIGNSRSNNRASARDRKEAEVAGGGRRGGGTEVLHEKNKDSAGGLSGTESVKTCTNDGMEEKMVKRSNRAFERAVCQAREHGAEKES